MIAMPAWAVEPVLPPDATETFTRVEALGSHRVATGPHDGTLPVEIAEGAVTRRVWRMAASDGTLAIMGPLRDALEADGWQVVFACEARGCGGFEFRFAINVTRAPEMFVDLADFRYLAARRGSEWVTALISRSGDAAYVQTTEVDPDAEVEEVTGSAPAAVAPVAALPQGEVATALREVGHAVLSDLEFETGSAALQGAEYESLAALAEWLADNPDATVALVGHTDAQGGAAGNLAISRRRAESARDLLIRRHGIASGRLETHGVGSFAPIAPNDTEAGREANRRVEAVVTSQD